MQDSTVYVRLNLNPINKASILEILRKEGCSKIMLVQPNDELSQDQLEETVLMLVRKFPEDVVV